MSFTKGWKAGKCLVIIQGSEGNGDDKSPNFNFHSCSIFDYKSVINHVHGADLIFSREGKIIEFDFCWLKQSDFLYSPTVETFVEKEHFLQRIREIRLVTFLEKEFCIKNWVVSCGTSKILWKSNRDLALGPFSFSLS